MAVEDFPAHMVSHKKEAESANPEKNQGRLVG